MRDRHIFGGTRPNIRRRRLALVFITILLALYAVGRLTSSAESGSNGPTARQSSGRATPSTTGVTIPVRASANIYSGIGFTHMRPDVSHDPARVYIPDGLSNQVTVIDQATAHVVATFVAGAQPQHIVPSWDLRTLWVLDNSGNDLIPIDPRTGRPGRRVHVDDPYNLYFTPDGSSAIVVAEARQRLDFRDPHSMRLQSSLSVPGCRGINHADYSARGDYLLATCEFAGSIVKIDMVHRRVVATMKLGVAMTAAQSDSNSPSSSTDPGGTHATESMPQDVRAGPDGRHFFVADMAAGGVHVVDGDTFTRIGFIATGIGAHGITPSRDGLRFFVANRGSTQVTGAPHGPGNISVVDPSTYKVVATWSIPGGGSPDMGNLSADGTRLWLSGRFDDEVYAFDTTTGAVAASVHVGRGPHGLTVWPQPGSFSLGHTGNMR